MSMKLGIGGHKDQPTTAIGALSVAFAPFFVPRDVLSQTLRVFLRLIYFIARDAVFVLVSAGQKPSL